MRAEALLVLDCAYDEYVDDPGRQLVHALVDGASNIVMSRTFSKIFGLAGARIGWLYAPPDIVADVRRVATTFPLSGTSMAAARAALADPGHYDAVYAANRDGRAWLSGRLANLGLAVVPSQANFVLAGFPDPARTAEAAGRHLRRNGIAVRRFPPPAYRGGAGVLWRANTEYGRSGGLRNGAEPAGHDHEFRSGLCPRFSANRRQGRRRVRRVSRFSAPA